MKLLWNVTCILVLLPATLAFPQSVVINELMASNSGIVLTSEGLSEDWIELYNPTDAQISLAGMYLSDQASFLTQWQFPLDAPELTTIPAQGYVLVWASALDTHAEELHANFSLNADGEGIYITAVNGFTVIDQIQFGPQTTDVSFGRSPNGSDQWLFQDEPTPNAENTDGYIDQVCPVQFDMERGFYEDPITLTLTCDDPNAEIWVTLTGDIPHMPNSGRGGLNNYVGSKYSGPISIDETTCVRATAVKAQWKDAPVTTNSYIYLEDVMTQSSRPQGFPTSWASNVVDYEMDSHVVFDPAYEFTFKQDLLTIPSVSIVIPLNDFFGSRGIYSHAQSRGDAWEREACIEWIDPNTGDTFAVNAGLRTHGGVGRSSSVAKHSLRMAFRSEYGTPCLNYPLFPDLDVTTFDSLVLRGCWNYSWTGDSTACGGLGTARAQYMRDAFARDCMRDMGGVTPHGRHVNVYINGLYWGIYILAERPDDGFAAYHLGGSKSDYDVLKAQNSSTPGMEIVAGDASAYMQLFELLDTTNMADDEAYDAVAKLVDVPALIDYMLMIAFVGSRDAPTLLCNDNAPRNFYTIRNRSQNKGFIFIPWDVEWSLENEYENRLTTFGGELNPGRIFIELAANRRFKQLLADKIHKYFFNQGALSAESSMLRYWTRSEDLARAIVGESARWGDAIRSQRPYTRDNEWASERSRLINSYLSTRTDTVLSQLRNRGYYPTLGAPVFDINGEPAAQTMDVALGDTITLNANSGVIYYTLDGTDPMTTIMDNSNTIPTPSITARIYANALTVQGRVWLKARTFNNHTWSALNEAVFTVH